MEEWDIASRTRLRAQEADWARIPEDKKIEYQHVIPLVSAAANRIIYLAPGSGLTFLDLTTWKTVEPGG
jgi:hypothetical protein